MSKRDREVNNMTKIREIVKSHTNYLISYNDKRTGYRRMKFFCIAGSYRFSPRHYRQMATKIIRELNNANVLYNAAEWIDCMSWRGPYKAFAVYVPLTGI